MGIGRARFKGNVKIRGRPREQAKAEIMIMKNKEKYEDKKRRRQFFTLLDIIAILCFIAGIVFIYYLKDYVTGSILILIAIFIVLYFIFRVKIKRYKNFLRRR
jgi:hypothetical protein